MSKGQPFIGVLSDEDAPSLGRNKVLRLGACMLEKLLATLYAGVAQLARVSAFQAEGCGIVPRHLLQRYHSMLGQSPIGLWEPIKTHNMLD